MGRITQRHTKVHASVTVSKEHDCKGSHGPGEPFTLTKVQDRPQGVATACCAELEAPGVAAANDPLSCI